MRQHGGIPKTPRFGFEIEMPSRQFICLVCQKLFTTTEKTAKYCSAACYNKTRARVSRTCPACGKVFTSKNDSTHCSRACFSVAARESWRHTCPVCGKSFLSKSKDAKHCSRACLGITKRNSVQSTCLACRREFRVPASMGARKYCNIECKYAILRDAEGNSRFGPKNGRGTFACRECGQDVAVHRYDSEHRKYCSLECAKRWRVRHEPASMVDLSCQWCGRSFRRRKASVDYHGTRVKFCSKACNGAFTARYKQNRVSGTETVFLDQLEAAGIRLDRQVRVRQFVVDAVCVDTNVAIEFDGAYWHSLERIRAKDERKADAIAWAGLKLVRVPEQEWLDDPAGVIRRVVAEVRTL